MSHVMVNPSPPAGAGQRLRRVAVGVAPRRSRVACGSRRVVADELRQGYPSKGGAVWSYSWSGGTTMLVDEWCNQVFVSWWVDIEKLKWRSPKVPDLKIHHISTGHMDHNWTPWSTTNSMSGDAGAFFMENLRITFHRSREAIRWRRDEQGAVFLRRLYEIIMFFKVLFETIM